MAKFIFKLETVLRQRTSVEQQRQRELSIVQGRLTILENQLRAIDAAVRGSEEDLRRNRLTGKLDLNFIAAHRRYAFSMQRKALEAAGQIAAASKLVDEARKKLLEAAKQRKIMEKLREKQFQRWQHDLAHRENAELDGINMRLAYSESLAHELEQQGAA
jgi:flagellar FliJ protein